MDGAGGAGNKAGPDEVEISHHFLHPPRCVVTLGEYRKLADAEAGSHQRQLSVVGQLLSQAKYYPPDSHTRENALVRLSQMLCDQIDVHPALAGVGCIVGAPSTSSGFSEELTQCVAESSGLPAIAAVDTMPGGRSRKHHAARRAYAITGSLEGQSVLLLDDVVWQGGTFHALGLAASAAGAADCCGLAAARRVQ